MDNESGESTGEEVRCRKRRFAHVFPTAHTCTRWHEHVLIMASLRSKCGHYIFALWFLSFFLAYSQRSEIGCLPYFYTWCGLSENLECKYEMCCTRFTGNTANDAKIRHLRTIAQLCRAVSSQLRHYRQSEKNI